MAAFIVISADNRLHYLVDGIEKCRPLNPNVFVEISTGKITKSETGYIYEYTIHGKEKTDGGAKSFSDLLSNQLAAFRLAFAIPRDELVNIFFLENPLTENELEESESWLEDFDKVYNKGLDTNFCLFRVVFTYNHEKPSDVSTQIDTNALKRLLDNHKNAVSFNQGVKPTFERYLFYLDNQKNDAAALCLRKDEHDLKMPRILIDFMMLVSNSSDKYNIIAAINPALVTTRCFSVGYAESMYYYPDVERYYIHADNRDIHYKFLNSDDEKSEEKDTKAMDVEKYPFGLRSRQNRLSEIYDDVPFTDNIANHSISADYEIDRCITSLHDLLIKEREKEKEDFRKSKEVISREENIKNYETQIASAKQRGEDEDYVKQLCTSKEKAAKELEQLIECFPECPIYIDREEVYNELLCVSDNEKDTLLISLSDRYNRLVNFAKTKKFCDFVREDEETSKRSEGNKTTGAIETGSPANNWGCLPSWLLFWKKKNQKQKDVKIIQTQAPNPNSVTKKTNSTAFDYIIRIKEQLDLKRTFVNFKNTVSAIEIIYKDEKKYCEDFKLTTHTNHYFPLINRNELTKKHAESSETRIQESINSWRLNANPRKPDLLHIIKEEAVKHTKYYYSFIDWDYPFSFIQEVSEGKNLPTICNELQKRAAPIVNYNLTSEIKENKVIRCLFSDRPHFKDEMDRIHPKLNNGNELSATMSTHIASKICMFQFLPMDEDVLHNLVDLRVQGEDDMT